MTFTKYEYPELGEVVYRGTHESGLTIIVVPKEHSKTYAIIGTRFGSIDDTFRFCDETESFTVPDGVAHFLEHKLFEQPDGSNAFDAFSETGASSNAFTSFNTTAYLFSATDQYERNLEILLDFVGKPYFTKENVAKEQGIIGQEISMYDDDAEWRVLFNLLEGLYEKNTVKKDIAGTAESIAEITEDTLNRCYDTFYHPSNMTLITVGKLSCESVAKLADKYIPVRPVRKVERITQEEPEEINRQRVTQKLSVAKPLYLIGFKDKPTGDFLRQKLETELALELLIGSSSPLYTELYEDGRINDTFAFEYSLEPQYAFASLGGEGERYEEVWETLLERLPKQEISEEDFRCVKRGKLGSFLRAFNHVEGLANSFLRYEIRGADLMNYRRVLEEITLEDVKRAQERLFRKDRAALSIIEPLA